MSSKRDTSARKALPSKPKTSRPAAKKSPSRFKPPVGLLGEAFLRNLKTAPHGTSDSALVMATLGSLTPDQLKTALAKSTPQERSLLFRVIPADQLRSIIGSLSSSVLAPPPAPAPAPAPLNQQPICAVITGALYNDDKILSVAHQFQTHDDVYLKHPTL